MIGPRALSHERPLLKALLDFLPAVAFFVGFKLGDIYFATKLGIAVTALVVLYMKLTKQKIQPLLWLSLIVIVLFGSLTIALHDERFIKWKPTVLYLLAAGALLIGQYGFRRNLLKWLLGAQLELADAVWLRLLQMWCVFFSALGLANAYVAIHFPTETWVYWRTWGITGAIIAFTVVVAVYVSRHIKLDEPAAPSGGA